MLNQQRQAVTFSNVVLYALFIGISLNLVQSSNHTSKMNENLSEQVVPVQSKDYIEIDLHRKEVLGPSRLMKFRNSNLEQSGFNGSRHLEDSIELNIMNYNNIQYYGYVYVGTPRQRFTFMFDTGSSWVWLPSTNCSKDECSKGRYNTSTSSTYNQLGNTVTIQYAQGNVRGYVAQETVVLDENGKFSVTDFNYLSVFSGGDVHTLESDGLIGLSVSKIGSQLQDLFVQKLFQQKKIGTYGFTMFIGSTKQQSKLWIGTYLLPTTTQYGDLQWIKLSSNYHWQTSLTNVIINGQQIPLSKSKDAILDSGTSLTYIPADEYNAIYNAITNGKNCWITQGYQFCSCKNSEDTSYPIIYFNLGGVQFKMQPFQYLQTYSGLSGCQIQLISDTSSTSTYWLLGDNFLRGYYQVYDMQTPRIGLADYRYITNAQFNFTGQVYFEPSPSSGDLNLGDRNLIIIIVVCVGGIIAVILTIMLVYCCIKNKKEMRRRRQQQQQANQANQIQHPMPVNPQLQQIPYVNSMQGHPVVVGHPVVLQGLPTHHDIREMRDIQLAIEQSQQAQNMHRVDSMEDVRQQIAIIEQSSRHQQLDDSRINMRDPQNYPQLH
eukprot:403339937